MKRIFILIIGLICIILTASLIMAVNNEFIDGSVVPISLDPLTNERVLLGTVSGVVLSTYPGHVAIADLDADDGRYGSVFAYPSDVVELGENYYVATSPYNPYLTIGFTLDGNISDIIDGEAAFPSAYRRSGAAFMLVQYSDGSLVERHITVHYNFVDMGSNPLSPKCGIPLSINVCPYQNPVAKKPVRMNNPVIYTSNISLTDPPGPPTGGNCGVHNVPGTDIWIEVHADGSVTLCD